MKKRLFGIIIMIISVTMFWMLKPEMILEVSSPVDAETFIKVHIEENEGFSTEIIHSVEKTPVIEIYAVDRDGIIWLKETVIMSQGYGMPSTYNGETELNNGKIYIQEINQQIDNLLFRFVEINKAHLHINEYSFVLDQFVESGNLIQIKVKKINNIILLVERVKGNVL